eukprot:g3577.t1
MPKGKSASLQQEDVGERMFEKRFHVNKSTDKLRGSKRPVRSTPQSKRRRIEGKTVALPTYFRNSKAAKKHNALASVLSEEQRRRIGWKKTFVESCNNTKSCQTYHRTSTRKRAYDLLVESTLQRNQSAA